jgi:UPF0755 protein
MAGHNKPCLKERTEFRNRAGVILPVIGVLISIIFLAAQISGCKAADQPQPQSPGHSELYTNTGEDKESTSESSRGHSETFDTQNTAQHSEETSYKESTGSSTDTAASSATASSGETTETTSVPVQTTTQAQPLTVKVTIPEGFSLVQICRRLDDAGVNSFDNLFASATTDDFSDYAAIREAGFPANRCFQLEGYLFPDTYEFYFDENPRSVWGRFLQNFSVKTESYRGMLNRFNWTMDQAVTFASLLEREAGNENEVTRVSSVMHNRLASGMQLQLDASIVYVENFIKPYISGDINRFNSYYNTYKTAALPAGPICNPGLRALNAALNPSDTGYYYFANDSAEPPNYYYSTTLEEHQAILDKYNIK